MALRLDPLATIFSLIQAVLGWTHLLARRSEDAGYPLRVREEAALRPLVVDREALIADFTTDRPVACGTRERASLASWEPRDERSIKALMVSLRPVTGLSFVLGVALGHGDAGRRAGSRPS